MVVADEVRPRGFVRRAVQRVLRIPQAIVGWLLVGLVSSPIDDLDEELRAAGLELCEEQSWLCGTLALRVGVPTR